MTKPLRRNTYLLQRCIDVFRSCKHSGQVKTAFRYFQLAEKRGYLHPEFSDYLRQDVYFPLYDSVTHNKLIKEVK